MSTNTDVTTVEVPEVEVPEVDVASTGDIEAEVVSDVVEETTAKPATERKTRGKGKAQDVKTPAPVEEKSSFTRAKAQKLTERMKTSVEGAAELFIEAYRGRIWLALDYPTWGEYLNAELGELRPRIPKAQRLELVGSMKREAKMSQTAIADALGMDQKTVSNDLKELREAGAEVPSTSVGQDGRETATTQGGRRKPLVDRVSSVFERLDKAFGDLTELAVEPEWDAELGAVASRHRADVARFLGQLNVLQERFNSAPEFEEPSEDAEEQDED